MEELLKFNAYHGTDLESAISITKEKSFHISQDGNEWLGKGIYFWDSWKNALLWLQDNNKRDKEVSAIITVHLDVRPNQYFDLDESHNMEKLLEYVCNYNSEMKKFGKSKPNFKNPRQVRNFYCSLYKEQYNIKLIKFTFNHQPCNDAGFPKLVSRVQLCASDNSIVNILEYRRVDYAI